MILRAGRRSTERGDEKLITDDWLRRTFEQAPVGMALLEPSGEFVEANLAIVKLFGGEPTHLLGASARDIIHPDDQAEFDQAWLELETSETHSVKARVRCLASGGRTMRATVTISLVAGVSGQPSMVSLRIEDDTAERMIGEAASWSLKSNAARDKKVLSIAESELHKQPEDVASILRQIIQEVQESG